MREIIIVVNPGSTSTKFAAYRKKVEIFSSTIKHSADELAPFKKIIDQYKMRARLILDGLTEKNISLEDIAAVVGRGGLLYPFKEGGTYIVNELMMEDLRNAVQGEHASNLGALIANEIALKSGCSAYIVDPVVVDEKMEVTRLTGFPGLERKSIFHALNHKAVAKRYAKDIHKPYEKLNLIVVHLGGGISIGAHREGRVVDVNNALDGDGPFSPERSGSAPVGDLIRMCYSGKHTLDEMKKMNKGRGGVVGYLGTNNMIDVERAYLAGDVKTTLVFKSMAYQIARNICSLLPAFEGRSVEQVLISGGLARSKPLIKLIIDYLSTSGLQVTVFPGEDEMGALRDGAIRVLTGEEKAKTYNR